MVKTSKNYQRFEDLPPTHREVKKLRVDLQRKATAISAYANRARKSVIVLARGSSRENSPSSQNEKNLFLPQPGKQLKLKLWET